MTCDSRPPPEVVDSIESYLVGELRHGRPTDMLAWAAGLGAIAHERGLSMDEVADAIRRRAVVRAVAEPTPADTEAELLRLAEEDEDAPAVWAVLCSLTPSVSNADRPLRWHELVEAVDQLNAFDRGDIGCSDVLDDAACYGPTPENACRTHDTARDRLLTTRDDALRPLLVRPCQHCGTAAVGERCDSCAYLYDSARRHADLLAACEVATDPRPVSV